MNGLNQNHQSSIKVKFRHVDELLSEFSCILDCRIPHSPLQTYVNDISPELRQAAEMHIDLIRQAMCRILDELQLKDNKPSRSVLNFLHTAAMFANIAFEESRPRYMKGYGQISSSAEAELNTMADELQQLIKNLKAITPEQQRNSIK